MAIEYRCPECGCEELYAETTVLAYVDQADTDDDFYQYRTTLEVTGCRFDVTPKTQMVCTDCDHQGSAHTFHVKQD